MSRLASREMLAALVAAALGAGGCATPHRDFWHPGTIEAQRLRATIHDPYPDQEAGPEIVGGRPRDYAQPLPEAVRNRLYVDGPGRR